MKTVNPSVVLLNETQLLNNMKISLNSYTTWTKNWTDKERGGISTSVSQQFGDLAVGAGDGDKEEEYLITRVEAFSLALCVVNSYGEQRITKKEEVDEKRGRRRIAGEGGSSVCGQGTKIEVPGNSLETSLGVRLLRELLASGDWQR